MTTPVVRSRYIIIDRAYPADGVEFELTLNFDAPEADPMAMVRDNGYDPEGWKFTGQKKSGVHTRRFKLVRVGVGLDLDEVRADLAQYGEVPEGQWRVAFKAAFHLPHGQGAIGFADPSWVDPIGYVRFPYVNKDGASYFYVASGRGWDLRWLVPASK